MNLYYVYMITNVTNSVLYIGVTNDLERRTLEHKSGTGSVFARKYRCTKLVWFEEFLSIEAAIEREKFMKKKTRAWKDALIKESNPSWRDLFQESAI